MFRRLNSTPERAVRVTIDDNEVWASDGEMVAAVLLRTPPFTARTTPVNGSIRAPYCMMGVCFDCLAVVDGVHSVQTCLTPVRDGMRIQRQHGKWKVSA